MGFSRQEYWSVLPFPSPGDLSGPGIEARSPTLHKLFLHRLILIEGAIPYMLRGIMFLKLLLIFQHLRNQAS